MYVLFINSFKMYFNYTTTCDAKNIHSCEIMPQHILVYVKVNVYWIMLYLFEYIA